MPDIVSVEYQQTGTSKRKRPKMKSLLLKNREIKSRHKKTKRAIF